MGVLVGAFLSRQDINPWLIPLYFGLGAVFCWLIPAAEGASSFEVLSFGCLLRGFTAPHPCPGVGWGHHPCGVLGAPHNQSTPYWGSLHCWDTHRYRNGCFGDRFTTVCKCQHKETSDLKCFLI